MIIDVHCHVWEKQYLSENLRTILTGVAKRLNFDLNLILNAGPERLVSEMDDAD